ncbi:hypothetical protein ACTQXG_20550 [Parabacteroides distasonis]|jgi:hypothetical protein|uniref:hypothetical protein n=1 Tax=Parabacteroides distasonis TaxID=823 RepID=UPI003F9725BD
MERNIDMGQTVEEAAKLFSNRCRIANCQSSLDYPYDDIDMINAFKAGAEWQAKQSPWVSIKERLPKENDMVLCRMVSNGAIVSGYIVVEAGKPPRVATSGNFEFEDYGDYECDMWMPIPDLDK